MKQYDLRKNGERIATMRCAGPKQALALWMQQKLIEDYVEESYPDMNIFYYDDAEGNHFEVVPEDLW